MLVRSDWTLVLADLMGKTVRNQEAMSELASAQMADLTRKFFGGLLPGEAFEAGGRVELLRAEIDAGVRRDAKLFVPDRLATPASLVVMLHGCMQDRESFANLTGMTELARQGGFAVLYPDQETEANAMQCWNWYAPENQSRTGGEPEALAVLIRQAQESVGIGPEGTHLAGISAGGALTALMIHLYPELLASAVIVAGPLPFAARTLPEAMTEMSAGLSDCEAAAANADASVQTAEAGVSGRRLPVMIVHGEADPVVAFRNAEAQVGAVIQLNDQLDNGTIDESLQASRESAHGCFGDVQIWRDAAGLPVAILVAPKQLGHAWSGGNADEQFSQAGFDLSRLAVEFFHAAETEDWQGFTAERLAGLLRQAARRARGKPA